MVSEMLVWKNQINVIVSKGLPRTRAPLHFFNDWERRAWWLGREMRPFECNRPIIPHALPSNQRGRLVDEAGEVDDTDF